MAGVAEQLAGGDVHVDETVGHRVELHDGFAAVLEHHVPGGVGHVGPAREIVRLCCIHATKPRDRAYEPSFLYEIS
ncbi:hypothetical protein D3C80_2120790 [compost metagenome]